MVVITLSALLIAFGPTLMSIMFDVLREKKRLRLKPREMEVETAGNRDEVNEELLRQVALMKQVLEKGLELFYASLHRQKQLMHHQAGNIAEYSDYAKYEHLFGPLLLNEQPSTVIEYDDEDLLLLFNAEEPETSRTRENMEIVKFEEPNTNKDFPFRKTIKTIGQQMVVDVKCSFKRKLKEEDFKLTDTLKVVLRQAKADLKFSVRQKIISLAS